MGDFGADSGAEQGGGYTMKKSLILYSAISLIMLSVITGIPFKVLPDKAPRPMAAEAAADAPEVVAKAAIDPAPLIDVAASEPVPPVGSTASALVAAVRTATADPVADNVLAKPVVRGGTAGLEQATSAILSDLAVIPNAGEDSDQMRAMSNAALSGLRALRGQPAAEKPTLETLVANALREGQTDSYINALVNEAAGKGEISVPSALVTSDGHVDTAVLLSSLVTKAQVASGKVAQVKPTDVVAGGDGVETRVVNQAIGDAQSHQFYTVLPGDSLGSIAQKFYGDAGFYPAIFNANRALLSTPDRLNVGQRLVVPAPETL